MYQKSPLLGGQRLYSSPASSRQSLRTAQVGVGKGRRCNRIQTVQSDSSL